MFGCPSVSNILHYQTDNTKNKQIKNSMFEKGFLFTTVTSPNKYKAVVQFTYQVRDVAFM